MKSFQEFIDEAIKLPIEVGDVVLGGKFKNKRIVVKDIGENEKGDITILCNSAGCWLLKEAFWYIRANH